MLWRIAMRRLFRLWGLAGRDLRVLFAILRSSRRPHWLVPALFLLAIFGLEPFNFAIPVVGVVDDLVILPLLIHLLAMLASWNHSNHVPASRDDQVVSIQ
jgi:uncharacterized membrane protein YkvA (DUF1232 family)